MWKYFSVVFVTLSLCCTDAAASRIRRNFDSGWQFRLDGQPEYVDVRLPHDWSIAFDFDPEADPESGYLRGGKGFYRKSFSVPASYKGKHVSLIFDGVYHNATVCLNGVEIAFHRYGYTSFEVDLDSCLLFGQDNLLEVCVDHSDKSRWYTGSGIYRHVWLLVTDPVHVRTWGTYVTSSLSGDSTAEITCVTTVDNDSLREVNVQMFQYLAGPDGVRIAVSGKPYAARSEVTVAPGTSSDCSQTFFLDNPVLWDIDSPSRYSLETVVKRNGKVIDRYVTPFGIRSSVFDADKGFMLNGRQVKLKGVCLHQDAGCLGVAVPDRAIVRRLSILKEFGVNAIRCSHNPPAPEFLDCCDSLGLLVIDEAFDKWKSGYYAEYFDDCWQQDIGDMLIRDRNHPSIILWSIGNELSEAGRTDDVGVERAAMLQDFVHAMEPSRPVMLALSPWYQDKFASVTDVVGYNYCELSLIEDKKKHPGRKALISESYPYYSCMRPYQSRDYGELNPWNHVMDNDFICGSFIWAGAAYIGESMGWPSKGWTAAPFDFCMDELPRAGYYRVHWNDSPSVSMAVVDYSIDEDAGKDHWQTPPMVHDWTFPYTDSRVLPIHTPSNCEELVLIDPQGRKYGPRKPSDYLNETVIWNQPYRPGTVTVIGYNDGVEVCRDSISTSGPSATCFTVSSDRTEIAADGQDLSFIDVALFDADGIPVRVDDREVTVSVSAPGRLMGINSGELRRDKPFTSDTLPTYRGRCQAVVQSGVTPATIEVCVEVEGLGSKTILISSL